MLCKSHHPEKFIYIDHRTPEQFTQATCTDPADEFHLEKSFLGMHISKCAENIFFVVSKNVRYTEIVEMHIHFFGDVSERERFVINRFLREQKNVNGTNCNNNKY